MKRFRGHGYNLALTVLYVPYSLDSGRVWTWRRAMMFSARIAGRTVVVNSIDTAASCGQVVGV